ncbi:unnamed protein product [Owenia fusiformis]|uniref:Uncharacterized protein n=1 Tax=Owenia fusiformis TaxID=6347 RepID=A0A8J1U5K9_OWEFU|nr:unnamed protein product [Owenia fusiformis]
MLSRGKRIHCRSGRTRHYKIHFTDKRAATCSLCNEDFTNYTSFKRHNKPCLQQHANNQRLTNDQQPTSDSESTNEQEREIEIEDALEEVVTAEHDVISNINTIQDNKTATKSREVEINNSTDLTDFLSKELTKPSPGTETHVHFKRHFFHIPFGAINRDRVERSNVKTVPQTRVNHCFTATGVGQVKYRDHSCFCQSCLRGTLANCPNAKITGPRRTFKMTKRPNRNQLLNIMPKKKVVQRVSHSEERKPATPPVYPWGTTTDNTSAYDFPLSHGEDIAVKDFPGPDHFRVQVVEGGDVASPAVIKFFHQIDIYDTIILLNYRLRMSQQWRLISIDLPERPSMSPVRHRCSLCNKNFSARSNLSRHFKQHFDQDIDVTCPKCNIPLHSIEQYKHHKKELCHLLNKEPSVTVGQENDAIPTEDQSDDNISTHDSESNVAPSMVSASEMGRNRVISPSRESISEMFKRHENLLQNGKDSEITITLPDGTTYKWSKQYI